MNTIKMIAMSEIKSWELIREKNKYYLRARTSRFSMLIELDPLQIVGECYGIISVYSYYQDEVLDYYCADLAAIRHTSGYTYYFKSK